MKHLCHINSSWYFCLLKIKPTYVNRSIEIKTDIAKNHSSRNRIGTRFSMTVHFQILDWYDKDPFWKQRSIIFADCINIQTGRHLKTKRAPFSTIIVVLLKIAETGLFCLVCGKLLHIVSTSQHQSSKSYVGMEVL